MKVESVEIEHFKRVKNITIYTQGQSVELVGANEAGKSSVLDAIEAAIAGGRAIDPEPLHKGERKGHVRVSIGGAARTLDLERKFTTKNGKGSLAISDPAGGKWGQRELDELYGGFTFDPLAFTRLLPRQQVEALQELAGPAFVDGLAFRDKVLAAAKQNRANLKRDLKRFGPVDVPAPVEPVNLASVHQELEQAEVFNREQGDRARQVELLARAMSRAETEVADCREALRIAEAHLADRQTAYDALPAPEQTVDTGALRQRMLDASEVNAQATAYQEAKAKSDKRQALAREVNAAEDEVEAAAAERATFAASATLPVPEMEWTDEGVILQGLPFQQHSSSKRLRVAALLGMAQAPELRVMYVRDGSLLDQASFTQLLALAAERDYQLWVETVGQAHDGDHLVVTITEGEAVEQRTVKPF